MMFDAVAFAGGGNRCYWQGGFWDAAAPRLGLSPDLVVGVSAGAWSACHTLLGMSRRAAEMVAEGCRRGRPVPIGQFDITNPAGVRRAYEIGVKDGEAFAGRMAPSST